MSVEKAFRELVRQEIEAHVRPLQSAMQRLQEGLADLGALRNALSPLTGLLGGKIKRGPGRPAGAVNKAKRGGKRVRAESGANDRPCALIGCKRQARSKGYCAAHYQKYRNLARTDRLPSDWKEYASPNSVTDVVLPRGRAAAKALKVAREKKN
jgi:hypothetical protein